MYYLLQHVCFRSASQTRPWTSLYTIKATRNGQLSRFCHSQGERAVEKSQNALCYPTQDTNLKTSSLHPLPSPNPTRPAKDKILTWKFSKPKISRMPTDLKFSLPLIFVLILLMSHEKHWEYSAIERESLESAACKCREEKMSHRENRKHKVHQQSLWDFRSLHSF